MKVLITIFISLGICFSLFADEQVKKVEISKCLMSPNDSKPFGFYLPAEEQADWVSTEVSLYQQRNTTNVKVPFNFSLQVRAVDLKGKILGGQSGFRNLRRVVAHKQGKVLSVSYHPYSPQGTSTGGFLISFSGKKALFNSAKDAGLNVTYETPLELNCESKRRAHFPTKPLELSGLSSGELKDTIDHWVGWYHWGHFDHAETLEISEAQWKQLKKQIAKEIESKNPGKSCERLSVTSLRPAHDHSKALIGYKLNTYCRSIFIERTENQYGSRYIYKYYQGLTVYFDKNKKEIAPEGRRLYQDRSYGRWSHQ